MKQITKVFCDVDGVLCDFIGGTNRFFKTPYDYDNYPYELGIWDILDDVGNRVGFKVVNQICTEDFWVNLPWMKDGRLLLNLVINSFNDVGFITTPMPNAGSWSGRYRWLEENLGSVMAKKVIITRESKSIVAKPTTLLIDDRDKNIREFREAGGHAILVPRPWNCLHMLRGKTYTAVEDSIQCLRERKLI